MEAIHKNVNISTDLENNMQVNNSLSGFVKNEACQASLINFLGHVFL